MPTRSARICAHCRSTVAAGAICQCRQAAKAHRDAQRPSSSQRGYDAAWRRVRSDFLKAHPTCSKAGCGKPATDADHIQSIAERPDLRLSWGNLRPFCHAHHSQRTARDQGFARSNGGDGSKRGLGGLNRCGPSARNSSEKVVAQNSASGFSGVGHE